jgi:hypothetical protein
MHDWTRVSAGTYHDFHNSWITHLKEALNAGLLPASYYALGEQRAGDIGPDVLTLKTSDESHEDVLASGGDRDKGMIAVAERPPRVRLAQQAEDVVFYIAKQRRLAIRHVSGDRLVALVEIVSPANKHSPQTLDDFCDKVVTAVKRGIHVLLIDPLPPGRHDRAGVHGLLWDRIAAGTYDVPGDLPLTLVSYCAQENPTAYVEPLRVGSPLSEMPLFLTQTHYILVPLETTYAQAWSGVPQRWRRVIEATP